MVVSECKYLYQRGLFTRAFWMANYVQFAAVGTLYMYCHLWPGASSRAVREVAEEARAQFPVGVEGDLVGQRYVEMLDGLSRVTASPVEQGFEVGDISEFDMPSVDFTRPWSNLFFDPGAFGGYVGDGAIAG
ncbi:hypothetical protein ACHAPT_004018 [Fusarium lateritium]